MIEQNGKVGDVGMSDDVFVPYDELPKPHTGSFLTAKEVESFKNAFKDIVRVVRCRDCKHWGEYECHVTNLTGQKSKRDWFCADGERK